MVTAEVMYGWKNADDRVNRTEERERREEWQVRIPFLHNTIDLGLPMNRNHNPTMLWGMRGNGNGGVDTRGAEWAVNGSYGQCRWFSRVINSLACRGKDRDGYRRCGRHWTRGCMCIRDGDVVLVG